MHRLIALVGTACLVVIGLSGGGAPAVAADDLVVVKGHVLAPNGAGIAGLRVKVRSASRFAGFYTTVNTRTSKTGRYEAKVPNAVGGVGGYQVYVWDAGASDTIRTDGKWAPFHQRYLTDESPVIVNPKMQRGAGLSGRLTDAAGRPVRTGLAVYALLSPRSFPLSRTGYTKTTAGGRYRFTNLPAGPTTVCFEAIKPTTADRCYSDQPGGSPTSDLATKFNLRSGQTLSGVNFEYPKVQGGIAGTVLLDGQAIDSDGNFAFVDLLDSSGAVVDSSITHEKFSFREVKAGTYYLRIHGGGDLGDELGSEYYKDAETLDTATPIKVEPRQSVTGLLLDLTSD